MELKDLQATLSNIQDARPFEDLTVRPLRAPLAFLELDLTLTNRRAFRVSGFCLRTTANTQVEEVGQAHPRILETVENMVKKGKWTVPGYKEKFGDLSLM